MKRAVFAVVGVTLAVAAACSSYDDEEAPNAVDAGPSDVNAIPADAIADAEVKDQGASDAGSDASTGCNSTMPFIGFMPLVGVNTSTEEIAPRLSPDEKTLYLSRVSSSSNVSALRFTRGAMSEPWVAQAPPFAAGDNVIGVWPSQDGRRLYYAQLSAANIYRLFRAELADSGLTNTVFLSTIGASSTQNLYPYLTPDESELWFTSNRAGNYDIYRAMLFADAGTETPAAVSTINTPARETNPVISADERTIYFGSEGGRAADTGTGIRMAHRDSIVADFGASYTVPGLEPLFDETKKFNAVPGWISPDECRLYLETTYDGTRDIYVAWRR